MIRAKDFDDIEVGDRILREFPHSFIIFEVERIMPDERSVICKDNCMDFYPNDDDQYIVVT